MAGRELGRLEPSGFALLSDIGRCRVVGVVNVTPDSFSDGGRYLDARAAIEHGLRLLADGADILDVGGESTRPGAKRVDADEEIRRIEPVVRALADAGAVLSVDTTRRHTAEIAVKLGAAMVNDVSGGLADPDLPRFVADADVPYVVMHWRGPSEHMQDRATYDDVVADVKRELRARLDAVVGAGVRAERIVVDPGIGFAKTQAHNWALLSRLAELTDLGHPLLVGASRKSFLGALLGDGPGSPRDFAGRDAASAAVTAIVADTAWAVRVHDVRPNADAVRVAAAVRKAACRRGTAE